MLVLKKLNFKLFGNVNYTPDLLGCTVRGIKWDEITEERQPDKLSFRYADKWDKRGDYNYSQEYVLPRHLDVFPMNELNFYNSNTGKRTQGEIWSNFHVRYGKVGIYAKVLNKAAFWLMGAEDMPMPEVDIFEVNDKSNIFQTIHWGYTYEKGMKKCTHNGTVKARWFKPQKKFYWYECEITPYWIKFFVNGICTRKRRYPLANHLMHIVINAGNPSKVHKKKIAMIVKDFYWKDYI